MKYSCAFRKADKDEAIWSTAYGVAVGPLLVPPGTKLALEPKETHLNNLANSVLIIWALALIRSMWSKIKGTILVKINRMTFWWFYVNKYVQYEPFVVFDVVNTTSVVSLLSDFPWRTHIHSVSVMHRKSCNHCPTESTSETYMLKQ